MKKERKLYLFFLTYWDSLTYQFLSLRQRARLVPRARGFLHRVLARLIDHAYCQSIDATGPDYTNCRLVMTKPRMIAIPQAATL